MRQCQVLQRAFTALVADRAVERMAGQQKFQHVFTRVLHLLRGRANRHALTHRRGTSGCQLRHPRDHDVASLVLHHLFGGRIDLRRADVDKTHAAHAYRLELRVITKHRNIVADLLRRVDDQRPLRNGHRNTVNCQVYQICHFVFDSAQRFRLASESLAARRRGSAALQAAHARRRAARLESAIKPELQPPGSTVNSTINQQQTEPLRFCSFHHRTRAP